MITSVFSGSFENRENPLYLKNLKNLLLTNRIILTDANP